MTEYKVLLSCPPMLGMLGEFSDDFAACGFEVEAPQLVQVLSEQELIARLPHCDGWIIGDDPATRAVLEAGAAGRLKAAVKWGIGIDNVDVAAAQALGLGFINTPYMFGEEVADYAMAYVTGLARELFVVDRGVRAGQWPKPAGMSLQGKTVGLVGYGSIGRATARRLAVAGLAVQVYDPGETAASAARDDGHAPLAWPDGVEHCDFLVFTCALTAANRHMFNAEVLARCRHGVRVVNVARGPLIDTDALLHGLSSGRIHSAALDVFEVEPLQGAHALRSFERVIFGSHNASNTAEAVRRTSRKAIAELARLLSAAR
ncbi:MAG: phosphoglycerate dehydrogenase [Proteobacteria bacterium]|nr:phosphoglycerate dehydrogenase [Pseudomonadota bacterium]